MTTSLLNVAFTVALNVVVTLRKSGVDFGSSANAKFHKAPNPVARIQETISRISQLSSAPSLSSANSTDSCDSPSVKGLLDIEQISAWLESKRHRLLVSAVGLEATALAKRVVDEDVRISDIRAIELAAIFNVTPHRLRNLANDSRIAVASLPQTLSALESGKLSGYKAKLIIEGFRSLSLRFSNSGRELELETQQRYETRVLWRADRKTVSELRRTIATTVAYLAPAVDEATHEVARAERTVTITPAADGMSWLTAYLPNADASRVYQVLTHVARVDDSLTGNQGNRMADALVQIIDGECNVSAQSRNASAELQVLVSYDQMMITAYGQSDTQLIGEIASTGMLLEGQALLELLDDAKFRRIVYHPESGELLDVGRETYRPPRRIRQHVEVRDRTCRAPGCVRPAKYSDIDHITAWNDGGTTSVDNLAALCRTHHVLKTHGEWKYELTPDGAVWKIPGDHELQRDNSNFTDLVSLN